MAQWSQAAMDKRIADRNVMRPLTVQDWANIIIWIMILEFVCLR